jgi:autotransporter-associated beta strand protein
MPNGNGGASGSADTTMSKGINRRCIIVRHTFSGRTSFISDANILAGYEGFRTVQDRTSWGQNTYAPPSTTLNATDSWVPAPLAMTGTWSQYDTNARDIVRETYDILRPILLAAGQDFDDFSHLILAYDHPGLIPTNASGLATYGPWQPGYSNFPTGAKLGLARIWAKEDAGYNRFIMLHECGHNLRQLHAHKWETNDRSVIGSGSSIEYSDPYDSMAGANNNRGYNSAARHWLGYLPTADALLLSATGTTTTKLYTLDENATTPQVRALRVQHSIDTTQCYWIEHRDAVDGGTQSDEAKNSVFIRRGGRNGSEAWWLDWSAPRLGANHLYLGHTFSDRTADLYITPVAQTGDATTPAVDVVVTRGPVLGNRPPTVTLTASNINPAKNASITLTATATDPDGNALAYGWDFGDGKLSWNNNAAQTKSFSAVGEYVVQCRVSDMKGGETRQSVVIRVGSPTTRRISGAVYLPEGPIAGIRVEAGGKYALTDSNGTFNITGLADGAQTITARDPIQDLYTFSNQTVTLAGSNISGLTFYTDTPGAPQVGLKGQFYTGTNFNTLSLTRRDLRVDFDWGLGSPASVLPVDGFSARWTGRILAQRSGVHQFQLLADEGARLYVDGVLVINQWNSTTETTHTGLAALKAGTYHEIKIETKDTTGPAKVRFSWTPPGESVAAVVPDHLLWGAVNGVVAEYFTDKNLTPSTLKQSRLETSNIDRNYDGSAPDVPGMSSTNFSVRWSGRLKASATGTFTFHTDSDEGVRLWVGGTQVINDWTTRALAERTGTIALTSGQVYDLVLEYFQGTGDASVKLSWTPPSGTKTVIPISAFTPAERSTNLYAEFWQNKDLSGDPALTRWDDDIDFSWSTNSPDTNIPADNWSARWTGRIKTGVGVAGTYAIQTANDDGVRVWVNGTQVINNWANGNTTSNGTINLAADTWYDIKVEYYDALSGATLQLKWKPPGASSFVVVPAANLALWGGNSAPYVGPLTNHSLTTGQTLIVTPVGQDAESPTLAWSLAPGSPAGATIDPVTGVFTWTPIASEVGSHTITIVATDSATPPLSAQSSFQVDVAFPYLWDANTTTTNAQDGAGNWNTTGTNWWFGTGNVAWDSSRTAEIGAGGTPGNITLQSNITVAGLRFRPVSTTTRAYSIVAGTGSPVLTIANGGIIELDDASNLSNRVIAISANLAANNLVITKANTGDNGFLSLSGTNTGLTGSLTLDGANGGVLLSVGSVGALGTAEITVVSGSTLDVNAAGTFDNNLTLGGTGLGGRGALRFFNNINATFTGNIDLTATTRLQAESGATGTISGSITGSYGIDKTQSGTLILAGENSFTGSSNISGGTLRLTDGSGLGTPTAGTTIANGATLQLTGSITCPEPLTLNGNNTAANATRVVNVSGNNTLSGNITPSAGGTNHGLRSDAGKLTVTGNIAPNVSGNRAFYIRGTGDAEITGGFNKGSADTAPLTKEGTGTWTLSGTNSFNGVTTISAGTLQIGNGGTTGRLTATSGITNNASLVINRSDAFTQAADLGVAAIISGTGSFTQAGIGTTTLTALNTYSGDTNVNAGTLSLGQVNPSNESSTVRIAADATLDLAFTGTDIVDKLFIDGVQQPAGNYTSAHPSAVFTGTGTLQVTSGTPGFAMWITNSGLTGPAATANADPDNDGLPNLIEFILGGQPNPANPSANSSALAPTISLVPGYLVFTFRRSDIAASAPGISIRVEHGSSLTTWSEAVNGQNGVIITTSDDSIAPGIDRVEVRIPRPPTGSPPRFARLSATNPN